MGGELTAPGDRVPRFLVWASRDPASNPLARLQVIKGWIDGGEAHERVYDVACSDGMSVDPETQRCPDNGATVDLGTCAASDDAGAAELRTLWADPRLRSRAARPSTTCGRSRTRPAAGPPGRRSARASSRVPDLPATIQERAWSSPNLGHAPDRHGATHRNLVAPGRGAGRTHAARGRRGARRHARPGDRRRRVAGAAGRVGGGARVGGAGPALAGDRPAAAAPGVGVHRRGPGRLSLGRQPRGAAARRQPPGSEPADPVDAGLHHPAAAAEPPAAHQRSRAAARPGRLPCRACSAFTRSGRSSTSRP